MKLEEALLCVECESLYSDSSHCPQCGSRVSYPISRALNRTAESAGLIARTARAYEAQTHSRLASGMAGRGLTLLKSA